MKKGMWIGCLLILFSVCCYASDKNEERLDRSFSVLLGEGRAIHLLPTTRTEFNIQIPPVSGSPAPRSKTLKSRGSSSSHSRRSSAGEDQLQDGTDTEVSFASLGSPSPSRQNSPRNSDRQRILAQESNLRGPVGKLIACVSKLDKIQLQSARDQLIKNIIVQTLIFAAQEGEDRRIDPLLNDQENAELDAEIANAKRNKKSCCDRCIIM